MTVVSLSKRRRIPSKALTLVELVVVLLILVVLTSVAIQSTEGVISQGRFDANQRTLQGIENAVLGDSTLRQPEGTPILNGFVADVGRLPRSLTELVLKPNDVLDYEFRNGSDNDVDMANVDDDVELGTGWRGPYLRLPFGSFDEQTTTVDIKDGFGRSFIPVPQNVVPSADEVTTGNNFTVISALRSFGADGIENNAQDPEESPFDRDVSLNFVSGENNRHHGDITGSISFVDSSGQTVAAPPNVSIRLFQPDGTGRIKVRRFPAPGTTPAFMPSSDFSFRFEEVPLGIRVLRVHSGSDTIGVPQNVLVLPNTENPTTVRVVIP